MLKYLKYLLLIPVFIGSLIISFIVILRIPTEVWGCEGFGCFGLMFLIPQLAVILAVPIAILIFFLLSNKSNFFKNLYLSMKTFITKPFPKKKIILLLFLIPTFLLILLIISSIKTDNNLGPKNIDSNKSTPAKGIDETANWKTYTNIKYGIEFKYPSYLSYVEQGPNLFQQKLDKGEQISGTVEPSLETVIFKDQKNAAQFVLGIFQISLKDISTNDYLNSFLYTRGDCDVRWGFEQSTTSMMDLSNPKVLKVTGKNPGFQSCYYLINQSGNLFAISTYSFDNQASFKTMESLLNQILSTFNFLEQSDVQKNIQWVTYNNSEYGFTFQYPSEMTLEIDGGKEGFYDLVAEFVTSDYGVSVKAIHNIDIYDNAETQFVAGREISDSGFTYSLTDSIINGLSATTTTVDSQSKLRIVTIAHSTKNLFIEISFTGARQQLDSEILSTFKFID